ncbi:iron reductase domain protein [Zopfia rhizophila CBS 207.26]|uniref:Iron reductase domain protein n=1 Tax=Zopfia rhizophila CBS 207.26 TaxID=1314779 RepID=A0A6A6E1B4_9PEZI|nr:iron reductase domain protein [Zopfia rhizophila CBS 207.26]
MRLCITSASFAVLSALGQKAEAARYCDSTTSICYSGWTGGNGIAIGVAIPKVTALPFDTVLQIVSPIANGWVGFAWGGTMPYVPLTIGWVNNASTTTIYSSRMAYGLSLPRPFDGAEYTYLKGTGYNTTHWTLTVRCRGCSQWHDVDGNLASVSLTNTTKFAHAYSRIIPMEPANNQSRFNVHSSFGHWNLDLSLGQNEDFDKLVAANLVPDAPRATSSALLPSSTPISSLPSTLRTSIIPTSSSGPVSSAMPSSCTGVNAPAFPGVTAPGWRAVKVAGNLIQPRGIVWDSAGNLLVVQNSEGISAHAVGPDGCMTSTKTIISQRNLNHGIVVSPDGKTLYASSATTVWAWDYDAATMSVSGSSRVVVSGMDTRGHVTRTLVIPLKHPNLLIVSHGSNDNFDYASGDIKVGRSSVKAFDMTKTPSSGYNYAEGGYQLGYGLRNEVGLAFDEDGMLWGVENGSDEVHRTVNSKAVDIHIDNPADEINYLGDPSKENTQWYGYPTCYTVWSPSTITDKKFSVGDQFVMAPNTTFNDDTCKERSVPAKLAFQAHSAPLDASFSNDFKSMFVTFHGSWNRNPPTGYKVVEVKFTKKASGFGPVEPVTSDKGWTDIFWNPNVNECSTTHCFRPVSIAKDKSGRMYITSDSSGEGEIFLLGKV